MITVNCSEVLPIQQELLIYVSDDIGAIPTMKRHEFVLSPIENDETIDQVEVTTSIRGLFGFYWSRKKLWSDFKIRNNFHQIN